MAVDLAPLPFPRDGRWNAPSHTSALLLPLPPPLCQFTGSADYMKEMNYAALWQSCRCRAGSACELRALLDHDCFYHALVFVVQKVAVKDSLAHQFGFVVLP